ncbi:hypothetical protein PO883_33655 [Massilia sp. DJPM01]|uniref:hypothetical protein n=1 Tax=Massilia sp. DJPM01 TaxID=3024404 RepID=UPI00259E3AE4|nr:hypothetical protein [Massilia sp. DJPM01]MDM5182119.1 hypothetical protein [Massilia sp. DJPM01]
MNVSQSVAATLSSDARKRIALLSLVKAEPISHLADQEGVSRQFVHRQKHKVMEALGLPHRAAMPEPGQRARALGEGCRVAPQGAGLENG